MENWSLYGLVHNDIKDENCFWSNGKLTFIDWGNAGETGDTKHWKKEAALMSFVLLADEKLKADRRHIFDKLCVVFFVCTFMADMSFKDTLAFVSSEEFTDRFGELSECILDLTQASLRIERLFAKKPIKK
jgi:serine/threonine protein kinase